MHNMEKKVTIIVPLHLYNDTVKSYLEKAVKSIDQSKHGIIFVGPKDVITKASAEFKNITLVENTGDTDIFSQINVAAYKCLTPYFSVLEFDDEYLPNWDTVYGTEDLTNCSIAIPFNECYKDGEFVSFGNEIAWDAAFLDEDGDELGVITEGELKTFKDFNITGGIIKTEDFISLGGFKPEFKLISWFEYLMRVIRSGKRFYVIPRVCYRHTVLREGSYMTIANDELSQEEFTEKMKSIIGEVTSEE